MSFAPDPVYLARNEPHNAVTRMDRETVGGGGVEWGAWYELTHERDKITTPSLCFLADMVQFTAQLLPGVPNGCVFKAFWCNMRDINC